MKKKYRQEKEAKQREEEAKQREEEAKQREDVYNRKADLERNIIDLIGKEYKLICGNCREVIRAASYHEIFNRITQNLSKFNVLYDRYHYYNDERKIDIASYKKMLILSAAGEICGYCKKRSGGIDVSVLVTPIEAL